MYADAVALETRVVDNAAIVTAMGESRDDSVRFFLANNIQALINTGAVVSRAGRSE